MLPLLYAHFPSWLQPEIIPGLPVRWYGLMYIFAFGTAFYLYRKQLKERNFPMSEDDLSSLFFWGILFLLVGARLFSTLIYDQSGIYRQKPWLVFWPFYNGQFTGLQGMSYHGGAFFGALSVFVWSKVKKFSFREMGDMFVAAIPLGFTFGRIGNFINAELYGKVTASPLGMLFPRAVPVPTSENWALEVAEKVGIVIREGAAYVNLPRHPSQLYEAFFEGIVLWLIIWSLRKIKPFKGFLIGIYFLGYGVFRFFIEYFREPDADLGFRIELVKTGLSPAFYHPPLSFTTGQILCFLMILFGAAWIIIASRLPGKEVTYVYENNESEQEIKAREEAAAKRNKLRNQRKKLK